MIENYYYGRLVNCTKTGHKGIEDENDRFITFSYPVLMECGTIIAKRDDGKYIDLLTNLEYDRLIYYKTAVKDNSYIMDVIPLKKVFNKLEFKDKYQLVKTILLMECVNKLERKAKVEQEKSCEIFANKKIKKQ